MQAVRYHDMSPNSLLLHTLRERVMRSVATGRCRYSCIGSETDAFVPGQSWKLACPEVKTLNVAGVGHYSLIACPSVWNQINKWLICIDKAK